MPPPLLAEAVGAAPTRRGFRSPPIPCGEIALHVTGGYCVIADFAPCWPVPVAEVYPGLAPEDVAAMWDARVEDSVRLAVRFLIRANRMNALYGREVSRTNRIGVGPTGLHEWAWVRFGLTFDDLLDDERRRSSGPCWVPLACREGGGVRLRRRTRADRRRR